MEHQMLKLVELTLEMEPAYRQFLADLERERSGMAQRWLFEHANEPYPELVTKLQDWSVGKQLSKGRVSCSTLFLVDDDGKILGKVSFRHELNDYLRKIGGHIGYIIIADERGKGYGTIMLKLTLERAKPLGLERVLVTCDEDNIASAKVIEKNGGVFENKYYEGENPVPTCRYWITLKQGSK